MGFSALYLQFLASENREERFLVRYQPVDRNGNAVTLHRSSDAYGTKLGDAIDAQLFEADLEEAFGFFEGVDLEDYTGIVPGAQGGTLRHINRHGELDAWRSDYYFDGRPATVYHGGWSQETGELDFADYAVIYDGEVEGQPLVGLESVKVTLRAPDQRFDFPFSKRVHCGLPWHLYFDGSNDYVNCGNVAAHNMTSAFTVECRFLAPAAPATNTPIVDRSSIDVDGFRLDYTTAGKVRLVTSQSGAHQDTESDLVLVPGRRYSLAGRLKADGSGQILIDGELDGESAAGTHTMPATASRNLYWMRNNSGANYLSGFVNEVRLWNAVRTDAEISDAAHRTLTAAERLLSSLVGYWPCDEGSGATLTDQSPNANNGTISGALWYRALEGSSDVEGERLPEWWGEMDNVPGVLVETNPPTWQLHSAKMNQLTTAREGGAARAVNDYTDWATFQAATTPAGECDVLRTPGGTFARLNVPPVLPVTFDGEGDATDGTYRRTSAEIARHFVTTRGPNPLDDATEIDDAAWDAAATDQPAIQGWWWAEDLTIRDAADLFLRSAGFSVYRERESQLFTIHRFSGVAAAVAAASSVPLLTENEVVLDSVETILARAPAWETTIAVRRNPRPLAPGEVSQSLNTPAQANFRRFLMQEWRHARGPNATVRQRRLQARSIVVESSTFRYHADGRAEAQRRTALHDDEEQAISLEALPVGLQLGLFKPVYLRLRLEGEDGGDLDRLGTGEDQAYVIFAMGADPNAGAVRLTFYREAS